MRKYWQKHGALAGILPLAVVSLAACGDAADSASRQASASEAAIDTPAEIPATRNDAGHAATVIDDPLATVAPEPAAGRTAAAPSTKPQGSKMPGAPAQMAPSPTPSAPASTNPHAGHDMTTMSDEDMKAMGHN